MNIRRNTFWNIAEVIFMTFGQLITFRIIISNLGISALGIWSLVFSTLSLARIADIGIAGALTRFVAKPPSCQEDDVAPIAYAETALLSNAILYFGLAVLLYAPAYYLLGWALHAGNLQTARQLLPYATCAFILFNVSSVVTTALIGFTRSDLKSILFMASIFMQLVISVLTVRHYGLMGLALAQMVQYLFLLAVGWHQLLRISKSETRWRLPLRLSLPAFREMIGFAVRLQVLNIVNFLYDPLTKFTVSAIAGPAALGLYEAAYRLISQSRAIVATPAQNLLPMFAAIPVEDVQARRLLYNDATAFMLVIAIIGTIALVAVSPIVSLLLLHNVQPSYTGWVAILSAGWLVNVVALPSCLMGIGCGWVRWNIIGMTFSTVTSVTMGYILGGEFGAVGVVAAAAFAIGGGGVIVIVANSRTAGIESPLPSFDSYSSVYARFRLLLGATANS